MQTERQDVYTRITPEGKLRLVAALKKTLGRQTRCRKESRPRSEKSGSQHVKPKTLRRGRSLMLIAKELRPYMAARGASIARRSSRRTAPAQRVPV